MQKQLFFLALALGIFGLQGCLKDSCVREVTYIKFTPVFKTVEELHSTEVHSEAPRQLENPGKIYYYADHLFINELHEGVHVFDNTNPENPVPVAFLAIPGVEDIAIRNGVLYANSYSDLLAVDISNLQDAKIVGRAENAFPLPWGDYVDEQGRVLVYYDQEEVTEVMDCNTFQTLRSTGGVFWLASGPASAQFEDALVNSSIGNGGGTGVGGSFARFTILSDKLFIVDQTSLRVFDLAQPAQPEMVGTADIGWGIETIFPYGNDKVFIGSSDGMFIYDVSDPLQPQYMSSLAHARACDPVFVYGDYAYVTLRNGSFCEGFTNQLDLIDITDLYNPTLVKSFPMDNPHGLALKDDLLFLCEGSYGLKVFDVTDPLRLDKEQRDHVKDIDAYDVIALPGDRKILLLIGQDGFYQFDYEDPEHLVLLSHISAN